MFRVVAAARLITSAASIDRNPAEPAVRVPLKSLCLLIDLRSRRDRARWPRLGEREATINADFPDAAFPNFAAFCAGVC